MSEIPDKNIRKDHFAEHNHHKRKKSKPCHDGNSKWNLLDEESTNMFAGLGVQVLTDTKDDESNITDKLLPQPTPPISSGAHLEVPGAPKVVLSSAANCVTDTLAENTSARQIWHCGVSPRISTDFSLQRLQGQAKFDLLPDEIILQIFTWLPRSVLTKCTCVCKRWRQLSYDEILWKRLDLSEKVINPRVFQTLLNRGVMVLRLAKAEIHEPACNTMMVHSSLETYNELRPSKLQYLDLSMAQLSVSSLNQILRTTTRLHKLSVEFCDLDEYTCRYIGQNANLEVLNASMCSGLTLNGLEFIFSSCKRLLSLNIAWTNMHKATVKHTCRSLPISFQKLNISGCRLSITDDDVANLVENCPNLRELDLSDCNLLTRKSLASIASSLYKLQYLAISRCYKIHLGDITLLRELSLLSALDVFGMLTENNVQCLIDYLPGVQINHFPFSSIARPTTGIRRTSIWGLRVRDRAM